MFTKLKQWLGSHSQVEQRENKMLQHEISQLQNENESLREKLALLQQQQKTPRIHVEYFYYAAQASEMERYSDKDLEYFPIMGISIHFMDEGRTPPMWLQAIVTGLEQMLKSINIRFRTLNEPQLYTIFVDTKFYPDQDVRRVFQLIVKQLNELHWHEPDNITIRAHIGGDELRELLLESFEEHSTQNT